MTDGGRRGDLKNRSAARHATSAIAEKSHFVLNGAMDRHGIRP
jgi:hypothetical protein